MRVEKKISSSGAITLPKQMRLAAGLKNGGGVVAENTGDGGIVIRAKSPGCTLCGSSRDIVQICSALRLCGECRSMVKEVLRDE